MPFIHCCAIVAVYLVQTLIKNKMEAKKFRIGNLLTWKDQEDEGKAILTLTGIVLGDCIWLEWEWEDGESDNTDCDLDSIKGISITEDWLINFGFQNYHCWEYRWVTGGLQLIETNGYWYPAVFSHPEMSHEDDQCVSLNRIKYVHELQNLFFAITGKELELKELV